jgi:hypothetical protein
MGEVELIIVDNPWTRTTSCPFNTEGHCEILHRRAMSKPVVGIRTIIEYGYTPCPTLSEKDEVILPESCPLRERSIMVQLEAK